MATAAAVWQGNEALAPLLVPIEELRPHPRNPRRGVVEEIQASLRRFGQQRPLLALPDGTLIAGHHVWRAAQAEGWSHVALVRSDLTEREVEAYLLADNRLSDLGLYDDAELANLLSQFGPEELTGIGYDGSDVAALLAYLEPPALVPQERPPSSVPPEERPYALGTAELFRIILSYDRDTYEALVARLDEIVVEHGFESYSEAVRWAADAAH